MKAETNKKFIKLGRSWGMIIPPWFFKLIDINPINDEVSLTIENDSIVIRKKKDN
ncbi:hypothetical protein J6G99_00215 [bacterium]|nr:hypothetical protein [bacterium]